MIDRVSNGDYSQVGADLRFQDMQGATPRDRVELSNRLACNAALHPSMRRAAHHITRRLRHVSKDGPEEIARWVRRNIAYQREQRSSELLQGPASTLWAGVGDCDDLALLWVTLTRACGCNTRFMGVGKSEEAFFHAVGLDEDTGRVYELTSDERFRGGRKTKVSYKMPAGCLGVYYAPEPPQPGFRVFPSSPRHRVPNNPHSSLRIEQYSVVRPSAGVRVDPRPNSVVGWSSHTLGPTQFSLALPRPADLGPIEGSWETRRFPSYVELEAPVIVPVSPQIRALNPASTDCNSAYNQCLQLAYYESGRSRRRIIRRCGKDLKKCNKSQRTRRTDVRVARAETRTARADARGDARVARADARGDARVARAEGRAESKVARAEHGTTGDWLKLGGLFGGGGGGTPQASPPIAYTPPSRTQDYAPAIAAGVGGVLLIAIALAATGKKKKKKK